ncbi:M12 family metallo-peptidase [Flavobacterium sp. SUN046]|uniref:M12 family metallo-peptidase n=1 Tax=Flavobacterium sp. SUN046 TaxID=3002440 RepID=UPI002DB770D3|nr:M12 family metallo-peptidase [Flavobacterium sp. SUN046]MEC4048256.1 M12 family metallo-peptidase [Flavobacterium sp. SUN046]
MKKILTLILLFQFILLSAQNEVAKKVQELRSQKLVFKTFSILTPSNTIATTEVDKVVNNATLATLKADQVNDIVAHSYQYIELSIPYNNTTVEVQLYQVDLFHDNFHVDTNRQKNIPYQAGVYYRGIVKDDFHSVVTFNFFQNECNGIISSDALANLVVGKLKKPNNTLDYIVYSDSNLKITNSFNCATKFDESSTLESSSTNKNTTSVKCVSMYFEIDYDLYIANNSDTIETTNWMTSMFSNIQTLYANDGITVNLRSMYIWTEQDPYQGVGSSSSDYLYAFNAHTPIFDADLGQLIGIDSGGLGGVAITINGLCSSNNFSYADINYNYATVPVFSWNVDCISHEFGHLLGSPHTHGCYWNGNNTAIDGCGQQSGYHEGTCADGPIPSSTVKGTIMSYCHLISGVGVNFNNGFGLQPKNVILNAIASSTCLSSDCVNICTNTVASVTTASVTDTTASFSWVDNSSSSWLVSVYEYGTNPTVWDAVNTNSYSVSGLSPNTYYLIAVRPNCTAGLTAPSKDLIFATTTNFCSGIELYDTGGANSNYGDMETIIRTIIPDLPNKSIVLTFNEFALESNYDYLYVYDGSSITAPDLTNGGMTGFDLPGTFTSSAADGALTIKFTSDQAVNETGFSASISCIANLGVAGYGYTDFSYSPNPTNNKVTITSKTLMNELTVYNVAGQILYHNTIGDLSTTLDISSFATGTYFFKLKFDQKEVNFKILKM